MNLGLPSVLATTSQTNDIVDYDRCQAWPWISVAVLFSLVAVAMLPFDVVVARWFLDGNCPEAIGDVLHRSESFAHGIGIAILLIAVFVLDIHHRWALPRLLLLVLGAGAIANVVKLLVSRTRPYVFDFQGGVLETFQGWFPLLDAGGSQRSFPSAHTVAAVALAIGLTWLYPRGRWLFLGLAVLAGAQRLQTGSHFLSDVFVGLALGWLWAVGVLQRRFTAAWFDNWEQRLRSKSSRREQCDRGPDSAPSDVYRAA
ncbi:MAG: phosphatase PAP2 family protein [Pirellulales bacterium]